MAPKTKAKILKAFAIGIDVLVPFIATLCYFPVWVATSSEATVSGLFLILAFFCVIPFFRQIIAYFKSPSIPVVWAVLLVLFSCLRSIIDQMTVVLLLGTLSNIVGAIIYNIGKSYDNK